MAAEVAGVLKGELDVVVARKLGAPYNPELAIGALAPGGTSFIDDYLVQRLGVGPERLEDEIRHQTEELARREAVYRGERPQPVIEGRTVIVVDDGVATGATLRAVLRYLQGLKPARLVCAVPVGPLDTLQRLESEADEVVCPMRPFRFMAVGEWYDDFHQVDDDEVLALLESDPS